MKKNLFYLLLTVCMVFTMLLPVGASEYLPLYDEPDLLTDAEESALAAKLESIGAQYQMEVVIAAVETTGDYTVMEYADDFYDYNGYGYGENYDGLILMIAMDTSDWWISTCGAAITAFTDAGIEYIGEQIVPYMSDGDFYGAFNAFADQCSVFMAQAASGDPFDIHNLEAEEVDTSFSAGGALLISLVAGLIIALIYTGSLKGQLKSVHAQRAASSYVRNGSLNITESRDFFLYRKVTKTAKESNSGSGGGSSTHRSSSGRVHGGGGGKF